MAAGREQRVARRVRAWLVQHGVGDREPTPLLVARLRARDDGQRVARIVTFAALFTYIFGMIRRDEIDGSSLSPSGVLGTLVATSALGVALALGIVAALWVQRSADRRIAASLPRRVAHPAAVRLGGLLTGWFVASAIVVHVGGLLAAGAVAILATSPADRAASAVLAGCVIAFAAVGCAIVVEVVRRPAVADDPQSLVDDELLRREDALKAVEPVAGVVAVMAAIGSRSGGSVVAVYLIYSVAALLVWSRAAHAATHASAGPPRPVPQPAPR